MSLLPHHVEDHLAVVTRLLVDEFGEGCAVCGRFGDVVVDHDHGSGKVRGLLCPSCNVREGKGDPAFNGYREQPPAGRLNLSYTKGGFKCPTCYTPTTFGEVWGRSVRARRLAALLESA